MNLDLENRAIRLSVGDFAEFGLGPRDGGETGGGVWRAQLGTRWHLELRDRTARADATARFEVPIEGAMARRGWRFVLNGRIDQLVESGSRTLIREIKTVTTPLPADESELRREYRSYFVQAAAYLTLWELGTGNREPGAARPAAELVFVEVSSGLIQVVPIDATDEGLLAAQLERVLEFVDLRQQSRNRLQKLQFRPAFSDLRVGQAEALAALSTAYRLPSVVLFEAPTGFGKTGVVLQSALDHLRSGTLERLIYLTSKSTGQLQVVTTLASMTADRKTPGTRNQEPGTDGDRSAIAVWQVRNKGEHCVNDVFHCVSDRCRFLAGAEERWASSGLSRFYRLPNQPRDIGSLREAGRSVKICPYEITRTALAFNDVWVGDYNYVFSPRSRGLFFEQPGFEAGRTLLVIDEAHNLPTRAADCYSHGFTGAGALAAGPELTRAGAPAALQLAWDRWAGFLHRLKPTDRMEPGDEEDAIQFATEISDFLMDTPLDYAVIGQPAAEELWRAAALREDLGSTELPRLWWCPRPGQLAVTCLDASAAIGKALSEFGGVVMVSATFGPMRDFGAACGIDNDGRRKTATLQGPDVGSPSCGDRTSKPPDRLGDLTKRDTKKLYKNLTSAANLLQVAETAAAGGPVLVSAPAPWREGAYRVGIDARVDTSFQHRTHFYDTTADTVARMRRAASTPVATFFPSYGYAEAVADAARSAGLDLRIEIQPRGPDLAGQAAWVEESLREADALFLVLGSSFAESIDVLGGRISHAIVVGPALPEVNAVQRARLKTLSAAGATRDDAFRKVYQIPGMTKVNQALGRLVRAPGQKATILLHCRRFLEPRYQSLLTPSYQAGTEIGNDAALDSWLS